MKIAVIGATGLVGSKMIQILEERRVPVTELIPAASAKSAGREVAFQNRSWSISSLEDALASKPDFALFSAGASVSLDWAPKFAEMGCTVIDNSSAWRMDPNVPLVVPEINLHAVTPAHRIIANPNCSTIQMVMALCPLHRCYGIERIVVSTYQSVSGSGQKGVEQLLCERSHPSPSSNHQSANLLPRQPINLSTRQPINLSTRQPVNLLPHQPVSLLPHQPVSLLPYQPITPSTIAYPHPIDLNLIPQIGQFLDNGYTQEEMKMVNETRKILEDDTITVSPTTVRVPVTGSHSECVNTSFRTPIDMEEVTSLLQNFPGIVVETLPHYPMPLYCAGKDEVFVGRIRRDFSVPNAINMWIVADNLRKGAATNAVQILQGLAS